MAGNRSDQSKVRNALAESQAKAIERALSEAEPDWERTGQAAKRLLSEKAAQPSTAKAPIRKPHP